MAIPVVVLALAGALSGLLLFAGARRLGRRAARPAAAGPRRGRRALEPRPRRERPARRANQRLAAGRAAASCARSTERLSILKDRQVARHPAAAGQRRLPRPRRDRGLRFLQAGRRRSSFSPAAALWVYGLDPIGRGPMVDVGAVMAGGAARQQAARPHPQEHAAQAAGEHPQGAARTRSTCW